MSKPDRYAVMGHPISHSRSPQIHAQFARQCAQALTYEAIDVAPADFESAVRTFFADGGAGLNITLPFKQSAFELAGELSLRARRAGAVNTLWKDVSGDLHGDNTDGAGLVRDLVINHGLRIAGQRLLLLGAGGAARGVMGPLLELQPSQLLIANRTTSRATSLAAEFAGLATAHGVDCAIAGADSGVAFDLIINATSASLAGELPAMPLHAAGPHSVCYDMAYGSHETVFLKWARQQGAVRTLTGLGMLVEQAAEAFWLWRGVRPDTAAVMTTLVSALNP
jgi:shikimate dehydrogenase